MPLLLSPSVVSNCLQPHGLQPTRLLCPWDSPGKNPRVGCHALFQGIFPTQGVNPCLLCLLHWQSGSLPLASPVKPIFCARKNLTFKTEFIEFKGITHQIETITRGCGFCELWKKQFFTFASMHFLIVILLLIKIAIAFIGKLTEPLEARFY